MTTLTALLLLALGAETKAETHYPGASAVFQCLFESSRDDEIYGWPPGWTRRHGPGFPRFIHVRVDNHRPPPGGNCLRVELNGGAATAYGPAISVNQDVQYLLEGYVETSGLQHDVAYLSLIFLDSARTKLSSVAAEKLSGTCAWQKIRVGPVLPPAGATSILVGLHVEPQGEMQDLHGTASFGALWLGQVPRVVLTAQPIREIPSLQQKPDRNWVDGKPPPSHTANDATFLLFPRGQPIEIACVVSGFAVPAYNIQLELLDIGGRKIADHQQSFNQRTHHAPRDEVHHAERDEYVESPSGRMTWRLPDQALGFYRVRATIMPVAPSVGSSSSAAGPDAETASQAELSLAVIEPQSAPSGSEFGWSLSPNDAEVGLTPLGDLLCQCGIHWVKFPFPKASAADSLEPLINFSDRLGMAGVSLAGVLQPPRAAEASNDLFAAEAFSRDPKTWYPSIEPILARLATQVRVWQIGGDRDPGWIGCDDLPGIVSRTKAELDRIGQGLEVGIAWNLAAPLPMASPSSQADRSSSAKSLSSRAADQSARSERRYMVPANRQATPWHFLSLPCDDAIASDAIAHCLDGSKSAGVARWIVLDALPRKGHLPRERIVHLLDRMLMAKMHGAEAIFVSDPFDPDRGLVDRNGSPSELFLPWRTTALMLGGAPYVGDIDLPQGNKIHCFGGKAKYVGVLAGEKPGQETVYLGSELRLHDVWGDSRACPPTILSLVVPPLGGNCHAPPKGGTTSAQSVIPVQQLPIFLTGLDGTIIEWQLGVSLSPDRLPSVPSTLVPVTLKLKNTFPRSIAARVTIEGPQNWQIEPRTAEFCLEPGAVWQQPLQVVMPNDVVGGRQRARLDFEIQADRLYRFTMFRPLEVTLDDVTFAGQTVLNNRGEMEVRQTLTNLGQKPASFRCDLLVPDRRRQSTEVFVEPSGKRELTYHLPDGEQLLGKAIWIRAEEIGGRRVLNYRIETPAATAPATAPPERPKLRPGSSLML